MIEERETTIEKMVRRVSKQVDDTVTLNPTTRLLAQELLDSVELMELITALEESFTISIPLEELTPENFATVRTIAGLVERAGAADG